jgi:hypothetical protein
MNCWPCPAVRMVTKLKQRKKKTSFKSILFVPRIVRNFGLGRMEKLTAKNRKPAKHIRVATDMEWRVYIYRLAAKTFAFHRLAQFQ